MTEVVPGLGGVLEESSSLGAPHWQAVAGADSFGASTDEC